MMRTRCAGMVLVGVAALAWPALAQEVSVKADKGEVHVDAPAAHVHKDREGNVDVAAPGVRVQKTKEGVRVRAPFVDLVVPTRQREREAERARDGEQRERQRPRLQRRADRVRARVVGERRAFLGVVLAPVPEPLAAQLPELLKEGRGALIQEVQDGSPAAKAGLKRFDIVVQVGDEKIASPGELAERIRSSKPGQEITLWVVRQGKLQRIDVELGERIEPIRPGPQFGPPRGRFRRLPGPPAPRFRPPFGPPPQRGWVRPLRRYFELSINTVDENKVRIEARWSEEGQRRSLEVEGTLDEVREEIKEAEIPDDVKDMILEHLERPRRGRGWRFRIEPFFRFDDDFGFFYGPRIWLDRDGRLQIWVQPGAPDYEAIEELLEDLPEDLPEEIRERIERALRSLLPPGHEEHEEEEGEHEKHERHEHHRPPLQRPTGGHVL